MSRLAPDLRCARRSEPARTSRAASRWRAVRPRWNHHAAGREYAQHSRSKSCPVLRCSKPAKAGQLRTPPAARMISRFRRRDSSIIASDSFNSSAAKSCSADERKQVCAACSTRAAGFALPGDVEQSEKETMRADSHEIVQIASSARGKISDRHVGALERGSFRPERFRELLPRLSQTQVWRAAVMRGEITQSPEQGNERELPRWGHATVHEPTRYRAGDQDRPRLISRFAVPIRRISL